MDDYTQEYAKICEDDFTEAKDITTSRLSDWLDAVWTGFFKVRVRPAGSGQQPAARPVGVLVCPRGGGDGD